MGKAVAAMVGAFLAGGGAMSVLSGVFGLYAEAAALGVVGLSLFGGATVLSKLSGAATAARLDEAAKA